jgi:LacI family transcriptional regulator
MVSIKDVAKEAGVAVSTVSKVLNSYPNVSEATRKKVNEAAKKLNFVPNAVASALSSKRVARIAILMNQAAQATAIDEIDMSYISGAIVKAKELGLDVITIFYSMFEDKSLDELIAYLRSQSIAGLLIYGLSKDDDVLIELVKSEEFKCVVVDADIVNERTTCIMIDQAQAQYDVVNEVLKTDSANRILYIKGKDNGFVTKLRTAGIRRICEERGIELMIEPGEFSEKKAREITFEKAKDCDMIVCASDMMAIGAMKALTDMDIFRPVCGFDGITLMGYAGKQMSTVKQDFYNISATAVEEINRLRSGESGRKVTPEHKVVKLQYLDIIR